MDHIHDPFSLLLLCGQWHVDDLPRFDLGGLIIPPVPYMCRRVFGWFLVTSLDFCAMSSEFEKGLLTPSVEFALVCTSLAFGNGYRSSCVSCDGIRCDRHLCRLAGLAVRTFGLNSIWAIGETCGLIWGRVSGDLWLPLRPIAGEVCVWVSASWVPLSVRVPVPAEAVHPFSFPFIAVSLTSALGSAFLSFSS